ncbi:DUF447 domain-containing protein [Methanocaldococcus vulcanius]|uniref:DUF447 domain-containing protein n=1 Tax=Methanocaldococcus vulcanius TaxID=73913 RepID=UPI00064ED9B4|nr:DUF447 domain-containing protein [Methanocaldococcus vulcanius]
MINEVIITTKKGKRNNKAPIGVYFKDRDKEVVMHLFYGSHTFENMTKEDYFAVNITPPLEIAKAVLDDEDEYDLFKEIPYLKKAQCVKFYRIINRQLITKKDEFGENKLMIIKGEKIGEKILSRDIYIYNRADGLLVETAILYSRLTSKHINMDKNKKNEMIKEICKYFQIIKKVGNKEHKNVAMKIINNLKERYGEMNLEF